MCTPNAASPCYDGPAPTLGVGVCKGGMHVCDATGTAFGPCMGQVLPSADDCKTPADEDCDGANAVCPGGTYWSRGYGDVSLAKPGIPRNHYLTGIAVDSAGAAILTGTFFNSMDFGAAGQLSVPAGLAAQAFIAKIDAKGTPMWAKQFGGTTGAIYPRGIAVDPQGNLAIAGSFKGNFTLGGTMFSTPSINDLDIFVARFDASGNVIFANAFGGSGVNEAYGVASGQNGEVAFTGVFVNSVTFGGNILNASGPDLFVAKLDATGKHIMSKRFGDASTQKGNGIAITSTGDVVVAGWAGGTTDFGGGPLTATGFATVVARLDGATGAHVWSKLFNNPLFESGDRQIAIDKSDNIFVGTFANAGMSSQTDFGGGPITGYFFLAKLSSAGAYIWAKGYDGLGGISALTADPMGNVVFTGMLKQSIDFGSGVLTPSGGQDGFIAKLDASGAGVWSRAVSDTDQQANIQIGTAVATDASGNVFAGGNFEGRINFGDGELLAEKGFVGLDVYLARIAP